jgi:hypothetical protein
VLKGAIARADQPGILGRLVLTATSAQGFHARSVQLEAGKQTRGSSGAGGTVLLFVAGRATLDVRAEVTVTERGDLVVLDPLVSYLVRNEGAGPVSYLEATRVAAGVSDRPEPAD